MPPNAIRWLRKLLGREEGLPGEDGDGRELGSAGERRAARALADRGYEIVETNFALYKRVADDDAFAQVLVDFLYDRFKGRS